MKHYLIGGAALLVLSACATKPDPIEETPPPPPVVQAPPEVITPPPPPPVVEQLPPVVQTTPDLPTPGSIEDFAYQSGGEPRIFFGYDQYDLSAEARDALRRQANWMNIYQDSTAVIEGHADERGTREYNLALGARRADSVQAFLISQGVSPNRLRTISYGKERPIDGRPSETGWARNRNGYTNLRLRGVS
ncbi:MAG: OmpA family protein [Litorimonas sp.]